MTDTPLREDIEAAKHAMPKAIGTKREIQHLHEYLWEGEHVDRIMGGTYGSGQGLLALTDRRLLFLNHGVMSQKSEDFPIEKISSIQWSAGMLMGTVTIYASGNKAEIKNVDKGAGKLLVDIVRDRVAHPSKHAQTEAPNRPAESSPAVEADIFDKIRKLGELRDAGILTVDEFNAKKAELLSRL